MRILICNERFLFRFGVDRVLLLLAKYFRQMGHHVTLMGNNMDEGVIEKFADRIIRIPNAPEYLNINEFTTDWLEHNWADCFKKTERPDVILVAGWPFFSAISFFNTVCKSVIFHDYGAVSSEGMEGGALVIQEKLKSLRKQYLPKANHIIAISEFIRTSQSQPDSSGKVPSEAILLGTDHMTLNIWPKDGLDIKGTTIVRDVQQLKDENKKIIFLLGRWEKGYKNSPLGFELLRKVKEQYSDCVMLTLAKPKDIEIPDDLSKNVKPLGFVDDEDLQALMKLSDIGISPSLWEGFNLPLAEMQTVEKPVFVFNKGAHPEVVFHPWYLCETKEEMATKILLELQGKSDLTNEQKKVYYQKFKRELTWENSARQMLEVFTKLVYKNSVILMDVTNSSHDTANSGVIRVTRQIGSNLQRRVNTIFVLWDYSIGKYVFPNNDEIEILSSYGGPIGDKIQYISPNNKRVTVDEALGSFKDKDLWMLMVEITNEQQGRRIRPYLREKGIKIAHVFHDAIPILHPHLCSEVVTANHGLYMTGLAECDLVISDSKISADALLDFWKQHHINAHAEVKCNLLPGELKGITRNNEIDTNKSKTVKMLCVSTLEPRKNHKTLLAACEILMKEHKEFDWELILVGNRYAGNEEIPQLVEQVGKSTGRVKWLGVVSDEELIKLYKECTFTVYPSLVEGFGMPVMESLWNGRPCICYEKESMGELAQGGGCLTVDIKDEKAVANAMYRLGTDVEFRKELQKQAVTRYIKLWDDYALTLLSDFNEVGKGIPQIKKREDFNKDWYEVIYAHKKYMHQVLSNAERIGLTGILTSYNPNCCIHIGQEREPLNIIAEHSERVFDIVTSRDLLSNEISYKNITTLEGEARSVLPILLDELSKNEIQADFVFIDGNSQSDSLQELLKLINTQEVQVPMFIAVYNSFIPKVRKEIISIDWMNISQVSWLDVDFIPGQVQKDKKDLLELKGGIALIYINQYVNKVASDINQSAQDSFNYLSKLNKEWEVK